MSSIPGGALFYNMNDKQDRKITAWLIELEARFAQSQGECLKMEPMDRNNLKEIKSLEHPGVEWTALFRHFWETGNSAHASAALHAVLKHIAPRQCALTEEPFVTHGGNPERWAALDELFEAIDELNFENDHPLNVAWDAFFGPLDRPEEKA